MKEVLCSMKGKAAAEHFAWAISGWGDTSSDYTDSDLDDFDFENCDDDAEDSE